MDNCLRAGAPAGGVRTPRSRSWLSKFRELRESVPRHHRGGHDRIFTGINDRQQVGSKQARAICYWAAPCDRAIPTGRTVTDAALARRIGEPDAVRAVANACAANALALAIPCHRVVRSDGTLSGYRWGVERKRALLAREAQG